MRLRNLPSGPLKLLVQGPIPKQWTASFAIVGSMVPGNTLFPQTASFKRQMVRLVTSMSEMRRLPGLPMMALASRVNLTFLQSSLHCHVAHHL
ncbi:MAG: hypothetical protein E5X77_26335 [Mesorhizobium sp.]|nr:MAG: hypothetical protein E5X77_26335 [Mesorhizobium sp.]